MHLVLAPADCAALETAAHQERRVRRWRRFHAILLLAGVEAQAHGGGNWVLDPTGEEALVGLDRSV